jgi:hypothetical protein
MSCVNGFYAAARKDILLAEKAVKKFFINFFNEEGRE